MSGLKCRESFFKPANSVVAGNFIFGQACKHSFRDGFGTEEVYTCVENVTTSLITIFFSLQFSKYTVPTINKNFS